MTESPRDARPNQDATNTPIGRLELAAAGSYRVGDVEFRFATLEIIRDGQVQRVAPKAMAVMLALCQQAGETLSHDRLLDLVWPNDDPTPDVLSRAVRDLRRALGDTTPAQSSIQTVPRIGYRLRAAAIAVASVESDSSHSTSLAAQPLTKAPSASLVGVAVAAGLIAIAAAGWLAYMQPHAVPTSQSSIVVTAAERIVVSTTGAEYHPSLSPDGTWLAYVQTEPSNLQLSRVIIAKADGSQPRPMSDLPLAQESAPTWSNDGRRVAYTRSTAQGCEVMIARPLEEPEAPPRSFARCANDALYPVRWAHDDQGLWASRPSTDGGDLGVQIVFMDLNGQERLLDYSRQPTDLDMSPSPSPDGQWLVFKRGSGVHGDLYRVSTLGGDAEQITQRDGYYGRIAWYPSSQAIVYSRGSAVARGLYRTELDSGQTQELGIADADNPSIAAGQLIYERLRQRAMITEISIATDTGEIGLDSHVSGEFAPSTGSNFEAVYAPDSSRVAFVSDRTGSPQIWVRDAIGTQPRQLTDWPAMRVLDLAWSADGEQLSLVTIDANKQIVARIVRVAQTQVIAIDQAQRLELPQRVIAKPRLLANGQLAWMARGADGWSAYVASLSEPLSEVEPVGGLSQLELVLLVDNDTVYLTDPVKGEILRLEPPYEQVRIAASGLSRWVPDRWRLAQDAVWFVWLDDDGSRSVLYRSMLPGPAQPQAVLSLGELRVNPVFEIAPDASRVLVRGVADDQTDIAMQTLPVLSEPTVP